MTRSVVPCLLVALACSCGSGGSSSAPPASAPAAPSAPVVTVAVTAANGVDFAAVAVRGVFDLVNLTYIAASFLRRPVPEDPNAPASSVTVSAEVEGPDGGTAVYTLDDLDQDGEFSTGDVVTIDFNGYADGDLTLDGVVFLEDLHAQGRITQGGGTFLADATLRLLNLEYQLGAGTFALSAELPFRLENREILEIYDLVLFEPVTVGTLELEAGSRWLRYAGDAGLVLDVEGAAYSPALDGVAGFETSTFANLNELTGELSSGALRATGTEGSFVELVPEVPSPANFNCFFFGIGCGFEVRIEEDGEEGFESTQLVQPTSLLPQ